MQGFRNYCCISAKEKGLRLSMRLNSFLNATNCVFAYSNFAGSINCIIFIKQKKKTNMSEMMISVLRVIQES